MAGRKSDLEHSFIKSLRRANQLQCHLKDCSGRFADTEERIKQHFSTAHQEVLDSRKATLTQCISDCRKYNAEGPKAKQPTITPPQGAVEDADASQDLATTAFPRYRAASKTVHTSRDPAFGRGPQTITRALYDPNNPSKETTPNKTRQSNRPRTQSQATPNDEYTPDDEHITPLIKQPEARPISHEQLVAEVKGIYAGLVMVESKCIEVDNAQGGKLNNEQWQALIALHSILLNEHADFFLASQHPSANPALRRLASKYAKPSRIWYHGIRSFLAQPNALRQLCHYSKLLCVPSLFTVARKLIMGLYDPCVNTISTTTEEWTSFLRQRCKDASYIPSTTRRIKSRSFLPVLVYGKTVMSLPDTQASRNIVTEDYAASVGALIDRDPANQCTFTDAVGGQIHSSGTVQMDIALPHAPTRLINVTFSVVKNCLEPLVLGNSFLEEHQIFTKNGYSHNLVKASSGLTHSNGIEMFRLMHMGDLEKKLVCSIDSRPAFAKADSGSDFNLFSEDYVLSRGFIIKRFKKGETSYVKLADGSQKHLAGYVEAGLSVNGSETPHRFYVLKGLVCDVLLGDGTLEALDVFQKCPDAFVSQGNQKESFCAIKWEERSKEVENSVEATLRSLDHGEDLSQEVGRWSRLRSAFSNRPDEHRRPDTKETIRQLRERLHEINIIESGWRDEPQQKQDLYKARKKIHDELRGRILKHINDLSTLKRTSSGLYTSTSTTTNPSTRT
ncbi:hypothetical protein E8E14_007671 [Neopestalotiopsis sp. 37M]|nr:hypothetical protein E8E14_007671 [Neopestalotiopsis sp. 37M]